MSAQAIWQELKLGTKDQTLRLTLRNQIMRIMKEMENNFLQLSPTNKKKLSKRKFICVDLYFFNLFTNLIYIYQIKFNNINLPIRF